MLTCNHIITAFSRIIINCFTEKNNNNNTEFLLAFILEAVWASKSLKKVCEKQDIFLVDFLLYKSYLLYLFLHSQCCFHQLTSLCYILPAFPKILELCDLSPSRAKNVGPLKNEWPSAGSASAYKGALTVRRLHHLPKSLTLEHFHP